MFLQVRLKATLPMLDRVAVKMVSRTFPGYSSRATGRRCSSAAVVATADRDDDVLLAVVHVGHRRSALRRRHVDRTDFLPSTLSYARSIAPRTPAEVVVTRRSRPPRPAIFVVSVPMMPGLPGTRDGHPFERRMVVHVVERLTVRDLPLDGALVRSIAVMRPYGGLISGRP